MVTATLIEGTKYESGISGQAEVRFGGKVWVNPCQVKDSKLKVIALHEFYNKHNAGDTCHDEVHDSQVVLVFDNIRSIDIMQEALNQIRDMMKRDIEQEPPQEAEHDPELDIKIEDCREDLSVRAFSICKANGIETLGDLTKLHKTDWLKFRNGGKKSLECIDDLLTKHGLTWAKWE